MKIYNSLVKSFSSDNNFVISQKRITDLVLPHKYFRFSAVPLPLLLLCIVFTHKYNRFVNHSVILVDLKIISRWPFSVTYFFTHPTTVFFFCSRVYYFHISKIDFFQSLSVNFRKDPNIQTFRVWNSIRRLWSILTILILIFWYEKWQCIKFHSQEIRLMLFHIRNERPLYLMSSCNIICTFHK